MNWLNPTADQLAALEVLNASAPMNYHIAPVLDASGAAWVSGSLQSAPEYAHFHDWLAALLGQNKEPSWPVSED